jgi:hypothetical protein
MLRLLRDPKLQLFWFIFHAVLGFACVKSKFPLILWFYVVCINMAISVFSKKDSQYNLICFLAYIMGFEVLARGVNATPFIPHEVGKYTALLGFMVGIAMGGPIKKISLYGVGMLLLSIPGVLLMPDYYFKDIVFNYFGPAALFLGVIFCSRQIINYTQFKDLIRTMVYSIFTLACFAIFKASTFENIEYTLSANFEASGGSITNQVATLFGTAICCIIIMYLSGQRLFKYKWMDLSLLLLFTIRGLLTFSRGGMVSALLAIIIILVMPKAKAAWQDHEVRIRKLNLPAILVVGIILVGSFYFVNAMTNNYLLYRYQGQTARSINTGFSNDITLNQITSGRVTIFKSDLNMFMAYPALGVGVGQTKWRRPEFGGDTKSGSHIEMSRLMAEHGFFGAILVFMIFIYPFMRLLSEPNNYRRMINMVFLLMALSATFHNAMRTMITPLLFAFTHIHIVPDSYDWRAHLKSKKRFTPRKVIEEQEPEPA